MTKAKIVLGEILEEVAESVSLKSSIRKSGPTFFSDKTNLTYYVNVIKSGDHNLSFSRSKRICQELESFLQKQGFDVDKHNRGHAMIHDITSDVIADLINETEQSFRK